MVHRLLAADMDAPTRVRKRQECPDKTTREGLERQQYGGQQQQQQKHDAIRRANNREPEPYRETMVSSAKKHRLADPGF